MNFDAISPQGYFVGCLVAAAFAWYFFGSVKTGLRNWLLGDVGSAIKQVINTVGHSPSGAAVTPATPEISTTTTDLYNLTELERLLGIVGADGTDPELIEFRANRIKAKAAEVTAKMKKKSNSGD
ncbi:MAG: hypothetical protein LBT46_04855 [Planctomycetaceae bacterium]|jgi:hypothetical protein|nr:hypothetical protein [Planctomycetaceae bacterium]